MLTCWGAATCGIHDGGDGGAVGDREWVMVRTRVSERLRIDPCGMNEVFRDRAARGSRGRTA